MVPGPPFQVPDPSARVYLLSAHCTYMSSSWLSTPVCVICPASQLSCVLTQVCRHTQDLVHTRVQIPLPAHSPPLPQD